MSGGHPFSADRNEVETGGLSDGVDYQHSESDRLYGEAYLEIIKSYNAEQDRSTIEKTFMDLMDLAQSMSQEQQR